MIRRCYHVRSQPYHIAPPIDMNNQLVSKNIFIVVSSSTCHREHTEPFFTQTPLVLLLVVSIVISLWSTVSIIRLVTSIKAKDPSPSLEQIGISWLCKRPTIPREALSETLQT